MPNTPANAKPDRHFVTALARGLDVLSAFRSRDRMLGNQELARRCGLPKSTISRLTYTLVKHGYLEHTQDEAGNPGYKLGSAVLALGSAMIARMDMRALARPLMQDLADRSGAQVIGIHNATQGAIRDIAPWVAPPEQREIAETAARLGAERLKPIHEHFAGRYSYEQIRITLIKKAESPAGAGPRG